jgi:hypothetical protein
VVSNATPERWMAVWKVLANAVDSNHKDVAAAATVSLLRLAAKRTDLPLPTAEAKAFIPLLKAAGMMAS